MAGAGQALPALQAQGPDGNSAHLLLGHRVWVGDPHHGREAVHTEEPPARPPHGGPWTPSPQLALHQALA